MKSKGMRVGLSVASMLPFSFFLPLAVSMSLAAGYRMWQELPFRLHFPWLLRLVLKVSGIEMHFAEPAWNPTTWWKHFVVKELGEEGAPTKIQDVLFFPSAEACARRFEAILKVTGARALSHHIREAALVEIHRGLGRTIPELLSLALGTPSLKFVLDTRHYLLMPSSSQVTTEQLHTLLQSVGLVHAQAKNTEEWTKFLAGRATEFGDLLTQVRELGYTGQYVVEYPPLTGGKRELVDPLYLTQNLKMVRQKLDEFLPRI